MAEELIRAACEAANCKYPGMEAMANFKREVTPSVVIGLIDGLRHAKGMAAINDARANGAAETIQHLRDDIAELRAQLPSQGGEAVAAQVRWRRPEIGRPDWSVWQPAVVSDSKPARCVDSQGYEVEYRLLYTHPAGQVEESVVAVPRDKLQGLLWYADQLLAEVNAGARYAGSTAAEAEHSDVDYLELSALLEVKS